MHKKKLGRTPRPPKVAEPLSSKIYIYARVSKEDGKDTVSQSIENQIQRCRDFMADFVAKKFPHHTFDPEQLYIDDGVSGGKPFTNRPGGGRLNLKLKPGDLVLMTAWDRGFRNLLDFLDTFERWRKQNIYVITVNMPLDPTDEMHAMMIKFMGLMGDTERALITKRIQDAVDSRVKAGRAGSGNVPYGFKKVGKPGNYLVVPHRDERRLGELIVEIYDSEEISYYGVQCRLRDLYKEKKWKWLIWRDTKDTPHGIRCREIYMKCKAGWPYYQGKNYDDLMNVNGQPRPDDPDMEEDDED